MRESNFAFPAQNKACVCITSQLYDRRALDTTSPLPLFNSLTHLTYLTSTSPRIREIMTMDGGLERLVRILHDFCMCPPPPENPAILYGLTPPNARIPKLTPALNPHTFDKHAAYRFSLAFQCIVNIGVRGSEPIRSRVVQAGTLDVVGCILEAWLANKGFAVGPSSSATGIPRETKEQRQQRRIAQSEQKQRDEAAQLQKALQRQLQVDQANHRTAVKSTRRPEGRSEGDESMDYSPASTSTSHILLLSESQPSTSNSDTDVSTDNSVAATPQGSGTPTGSVVIPSRDRSGTIIARPIWDQQTNNATPPPTAAPPRGRRTRHRELPPESPSASTDVSRAETETEDDGDQDIDMDRGDASRIDSDVASVSASPSPERRPRTVPRHNLPRRAVGIVSDEPTPGPQTLQVGGLGIGADAHIIINDVGGVGDGGVEVGVEDGIVSLETNDDFAMGAPPGAPGAIGDNTTPRILNLEGGRRRNTVDAPDATPRATVVGLPVMPGASTNGTNRTNHPQAGTGHHRTATIRGRPTPTDNGPTGNTVGTAAAAAAAAASLNNTLGGRTTSSHHHRDSDSGPYRDEDVLLSLQLLAYLSKYPHVRQAFYKPRVTFHPASVNLPGARFGAGIPTPNIAAREKLKEKASASTSTFAPSSSMASTSSSSSTTKEGGFFKALTNAATGNSRGKDRAQPVASSSTPMVVGQTSGAPSSARQTNVFSLVERFTFKPSSTETDLPNPPPRLPPEIQYWAGVIMRNACRKDDNRGGIRQCANMMCGKWESYPREFAKCRRCRKAKYCGKECQSTAWSEGHRFWCSAKEADDDNLGDQSHNQGNITTSNNNSAAQTNQPVDISASGIHISVASGNVETPVPVTSDNSPARTDRRQQPQQHHRDRGQQGGRGNEDEPAVVILRGHSRPATWVAPPGPHDTAGAAGPSTIPMPAPTAYVDPTTTAPRAESSMSRDRTVQPRNISTLYTFRPSTNPQIPEGATYLGYPVQSPFPDSGGGFRRRAETITGAIRTTSNDVFGAASHTRPAYLGSTSDWSTMGPAAASASASASAGSSNSSSAVVLPTSPPSSREAGPSSSQRSRVVAMHNQPPSSPARGDDMVLG